MDHTQHSCHAMGCEQLPLDSPHSRACGFSRHDHGPDCHPNCPTCSGGAGIEGPVPRDKPLWALLSESERPTVGSVISETREPSTVGSGASIAIPATVLYSRLRAITIHLERLQSSTGYVSMPLAHILEQHAHHLDLVIDQLLGLLQDYQDAAFLAELTAQQTQAIRDRLGELRGRPDAR